jgi:hypothetical protein
MLYASLVAQASSSGSSGQAAGALFVALIELGLAILIIAGVWKTFVKAGHPGWAAIVPIYNMYILLKIAGRPGWWLLLFFIPLVNIIIGIITSIDVAKNFGKGAGFGIGLAFLGFIFFPILGFGSAQYLGTPEPRGFPVTPTG